MKYWAVIENGQAVEAGLFEKTEDGFTGEIPKNAEVFDNEEAWTKALGVVADPATLAESLDDEGTPVKKKRSNKKG